jgi:hypothetical protein
MLISSSSSSRCDFMKTHDIEEYKGEIKSDQSEEGVDFGDRGLLLQVVQSRVLGKLGRKIQLADDS